MANRSYPFIDVRNEIDLVRAILNHPAGYDLDLLGLIRIRTTEENIEVEYELHDDEPYPEGCLHDKCSLGGGREVKLAVFDFNLEDLDDAVKFFVEKRHEREIGIDIEEKLWRQEQDKKLKLYEVDEEQLREHENMELPMEDEDAERLIQEEEWITRVDGS